MAASEFRFGVLGPLTCDHDGRAVPVPRGRQRSLLALLLLNAGTPASRDRLIDELWGGRPPASAVSALHVHMSKLRAQLGDLVELGPAGYAIPAAAYDLDARRLDELVGRARQEPDRARALLGEALALFRGEPLADVDAEGRIAEWRRALEDRRLEAMTLRVDADLAAGASAELVAELEGLVRRHPYEERLWGQLMLALYRAGRQADALDCYQRVRRVLGEDLGLSPGQALADLHQRMLEHDPALVPATAPGPATPAVTAAAPPTPTTAADAPAARPAPARAPAATLPRPPTRLLGRDRELSSLAGLMADPDMRLLALTGPGGVGKTRLLVELALRHEAEYADHAVFVRLEGLSDHGLVAAEIAGALAKRDGGEGPGADGLAAYLRDRELLLAVDNFEHVLDAAVLLAGLLADAPRLRVVVSSRTPLHIRGEQVFEVEPLELPGGDSAAEVARSPAVQLFLERALAANRRLQADAETGRIAARICRSLDGLPLAIELAASRSGSLQPAQIAGQLDRPLTIGAGGLRDLPDRQQTLQATIRWSYDLLGAEARDLLRAAGVFVGGFTPDALAAVAAHEVEPALDELLEASLVRRSATGSGRYELLELVRAFALQELERGGTAPEVRARHRGHYAGRVADASRAFDAGTAPGEVAGPLLADHANLRAALQDAIAAGDAEIATRLALGLRPLWLARMLRQECQELVDRLISQLPPDPSDEIKLLRIGAFLDSYAIDSADWNRRLAARATELGDQEAAATANGNLFAQALNTRDQEAMRDLRPGLLALLQEDITTRVRGWTHYYLALDAFIEGDAGSACEHAERSLELSREIGLDYLVASAAATRLMARSVRDEAISPAELAEVVDLVQRSGVQPLAAFALWLTARYAAPVAPEAARQWLAHAERIVDALGSELWPESVVRDEALGLLGIADAHDLLPDTPPLDPGPALATAAVWLASRDPDAPAIRERAATDGGGALTGA
jgi:predicted ATPase/DNA-binding SARP family transcriptional activator